MNIRRHMITAMAALLPCICLNANAETAQDYAFPVRQKKLIHFGWNEPKTLEQFNADLKLLDENCPADGIGIRPHFVIRRNGKDIPYEISRQLGAPQMLTHEDFKEWIPALRRLQQTKLKHNFILTGSVLFNADWFDDDAWKRTFNNFATLAWLAKEAQFEGICLDIEAYRHSGYPLQFHPEFGHSWEETQEQVRKRARQWIACITENYPGMTLFSFFWTSHCRTLFEAQHPEAVFFTKYGLQQAFFNGIYDAAPDNIRIIDGDEAPGYMAANENDYLRVIANYKKYAHAWLDPENYKKYRTITQIGLALYLDSYIPREKFGKYNLFQRSDNPAELLRKNIMAALEHSDEYTWIWAENGTFWPKLKTQGNVKSWNERLPFTQEAIEAGKDPVNAMLKYAQPNILANSQMTPGPTGTPEGPGQTELGITDWAKYISPGVTDGDISPKNQAVCFKNCADSVITQKTTDFKPGDRFLLSAKASSKNGRTFPKLNYYFRNQKGICVHAPLERHAFLKENKDGTNIMHLTFKVPNRDDLAHLTVTCTVQGPVDSECDETFIDDITLQKVVFPWDK